MHLVSARLGFGSAIAVLAVVGCQFKESDELFGSSTGTSAFGGTSTGGAETGGAATGGETNGGAPTTGGEANGGADTGGQATGGANTGGSTETGGQGGAGGATTGGGCSTAEMSPCEGIPEFSGAQTIDGDDADVCSLPLFGLDFSSEHLHVDHDGAEHDRTESLRARVGWSSAGLHVFLYVTDPAVVAAGGELGDIWNGDGVELFFAPSSSGLSGNTADDAAWHGIFSANPGNAATVRTSDGTASHGELADSRYETTVTADGYTIEAQIPWPGSNPDVGAGIAFDLALNSADDAPEGAPDGRDAQAVLYIGSVGSTTCGGGAEPWCDDRTWCTPTLE
ncbi:MAG: hypothetical protein JW751_21375 [Polyangiaceae bacterium]|nr:hypothetical protein [Polyangiaceae bacterium]